MQSEWVHKRASEIIFNVSGVETHTHIHILYEEAIGLCHPKFMVWTVAAAEATASTAHVHHSAK